MEQENTSFSMGFRSLNPYSSGPILLTRHLKKKARQLDARQESKVREANTTGIYSFGRRTHAYRVISLSGSRELS